MQHHPCIQRVLGALQLQSTCVHVGVFVLSLAEQWHAEQSNNHEARPPKHQVRLHCVLTASCGQLAHQCQPAVNAGQHPRLPLACRTPKGTRASQAASWLKRGSSR